MKIRRFGIGKYFLQIDFSYWWQILIRLGNKAYVVSKASRFYKIEY